MKAFVLVLVSALNCVSVAHASIKSEFDRENAKKIETEYVRRVQDLKAEEKRRTDEEHKQEVLSFISKNLGVSSRDMAIERSDKAHLEDEYYNSTNTWVEYFYTTNSRYICKVISFTTLLQDFPYLSTRFTGKCLAKSK